MFAKSKLTLKEERKESLKLLAASIGLGVVLIIVNQILTEIFDTPAFVGVTIMLLSVILIHLAYLVEAKIREECERERLQQQGTKQST